MMLLNTMQQRVVASKKRITVITAQAGAGSSTALLLALIEVGNNDPSGMVIFCRRTISQTTYQAGSFERAIPGSRYSPKSQILTVPCPSGKKVKIKFVSDDYDFSNDYISAVAFDHHPNLATLQKVLLVAGRVYINDWAVTIPQSWGLATGLVFKDDKGYSFCPQVENVVGLTYENPGLPAAYIERLEDAKISSPFLGITSMQDID